MKIKNHHNLNYFKAKYLQMLYEKRNPLNPWLTSESISFLDNWISKKDIGFEWGSGRSTIWFTKRVSKFISIEHDKNWYEKNIGEIQKLPTADKHKIEYNHFDIEDDPGRAGYVNAVNDMADKYFDFILIDGRIRDVCSLNAIRKIKKGGILILDNAERYIPNNFNLPESNVDSEIYGSNPNWEKFNDMIKYKRKYWTTNGIFSTLITFI